MTTFIGGVAVPSTHWKAPLLGNELAGGGLFKDMPAELLSRNTHCTYFTDFHDLESEWVTTTITSGSGDILQDTANGVLRLTATTINEGIGSCQYTGADISSEGIAVPAANRVITYESRVTCNDWGDCDWFIGLAMTDTTLMSAAGAVLATGGDTHVGFSHLVAGTGVPILSYAETAIGSYVLPTSSRTTALTNAATYLFGIRIEGTTRMRFYLNRSPITAWVTAATGLGDAMTPSFAMIANGAAINLDIDSVLVCQTR